MFSKVWDKEFRSYLRSLDTQVFPEVAVAVLAELLA